MKRRVSTHISLVFAVTALVLGAVLPAPAGAGKKRQDVSADVLALHPDIVELRNKVAASPSVAALQNDLGNLYARRSWDDLALEAYGEAVRLEPDFYVAWTNLGTVHVKLGDLGQARRAFQTAIRVQPRAALAHYNLGVVRERLGDYDGAMESYKTAVTYDPDLLSPEHNPQIVNNRHETIIRLLRYLEEIGSSSLPLENSPAVPGADSAAEAPAGRQSTLPPMTPEGGGKPPAAVPQERPRLGSLKMYTGRAEQRLHARADRATGGAPEGSQTAGAGDAPLS